MMDIKELLQRPRKFFPFPLSEAEMTMLWESSFDTKVLAAYRLLLDGGHVGSPSLYSRTCTMHLNLGRDSFTLKMCIGRDFLFICSRKRRHGLPVLDGLRVGMVLGDARAADLATWIHNVQHWRSGGEHALGELGKLLEIPATVGQLARMTPELVSFLSEDKQAVIRAQQKASQLPYAWAAYPKEPVMRMSAHITACSLLPKLNVGEYRQYIDDPLGINDNDPADAHRVEP